MGQFKPMVKMMTTEPSVILKLKKGGHVSMPKMKAGGSTSGHKKMADGGGAMGALAGTPALIGRPAVNAPVRAPGKPSMADRRRAMMAKSAITPSGPSMPMPAMKKGGKAEGGKMDEAQDKAMIKKAFKQHDSQEHKGGKGTDLKLKKGGMKKYATGGAIPSETTSGSYDTTLMHQAKPDRSPAKTGDVKNGNGGGYKSGGKAKKFATGGVIKGNGGGYATGGVIPSETTSGSYDTTLMHQAKPDRAPAKTGGVRNGNGGGFKMGGKASKKAYATGGKVDSGGPVAMPQGRKPVPAPVAISRLAGTYKNGGRATPAEARLLKNNAAENKTAMREAKTDSNLKYGSPKRMNGGGTTSGQGSITDSERKTVQDLSKGAYDKTGKYNRELEDALNPLSMMKELAGKAKDYFMPKGSESVTKTKESVTVSPAGRKRGGMAC
jgi:hypothetical protein